MSDFDEQRRLLEKLLLNCYARCEKCYPVRDRIVLEGGEAEHYAPELEPLQGQALVAYFHRLFPQVTLASSSLAKLLDRIRSGTGDVLYATSDVLQGFECGPEKITVIGAPPGAGKTALTMQFVFDLLAIDTSHRIVVANAEMPFDVLLRRELVRRSGVPSKAIRFADLTPRQLDRVDAAADEIRPLLDYVDVMPAPFTLDKLRDFCDARRPSLLTLDYLQKFSPGDDPRTGTSAVMTEMRYLASQGWGVLALSATSRSQQGGHNPKKLSLASFKESGEIEFNADACYLLRDEGPVNDDDRIRSVTLDCVKNRHDQQQSIELVFDMPAMTFSSPVVPFGDLPNDRSTEHLFATSANAAEF